MDSGITVSQRASRSLETVGLAIGTTTTVAESLAVQAAGMRNASVRVTENMASATAAVEENAAAAAEMRSTTKHITNAMGPVAATASQNAATAQQAALSTQQLAMGIAEIESTARAVSDQAQRLESLVAKFVIDDGSGTVDRATRSRAAVAGSYAVEVATQTKAPIVQSAPEKHCLAIENGDERRHQKPRSPCVG
jgi:methyl-accepting chemotaxis protein